MAGLSLPVIGGLGQGILNGQQTVQDRQTAALDQEIKKLQIDAVRANQAAQQAATLRQQNADANAAAVIQQYYGAQGNQPPPPVGLNSPPPQQSPAPGQPSVPMMQPGQMPPQGMPPLPPGQPGQGPAMQPRAQTQQPPQQPPPYRRIETQLQQGQGQPAPAPQGQPQLPAQIPQQPPAEGSMTFQGAVQVLQQKGVTGPALVDALERIKPFLNDEAKQQAASLKAQLDVQKAVMAAQKLQLEGRHEDALEANNAAMRAIQEQRLSIEASRVANEAGNAAVARQQRQEAIDQAKIPTGYERGKDGRLQPMAGGPFDSSSPNFKAPKGTKTGTIADRMNPTMLASVKLDISEGRNALETIKKLNTDTAGPYFAHDQASPLSSLLGRALTTEQQQQYEVAMNRMAVAIASTQSMGRGQISDAKVNEARKLVPQLGDKPATRALKLQQISKIFDMADRTLNESAKGNPAEPDADREAATAGSVPGGGNTAPKSLNYDPATGTFK